MNSKMTKKMMVKVVNPTPTIKKGSNKKITECDLYKYNKHGRLVLAKSYKDATAIQVVNDNYRVVTIRKDRTKMI